MKTYLNNGWVKEFMDCTSCGLWTLDANDGFCGFCGRPIITCDIDIQRIVLITGQQMVKTFTVHNRGSTDVVVDMRTDITDGVNINFSQRKLRVHAGKSGSIAISLAPDTSMPSSTPITGFIVCRLEGSEQRSLRIPLIVKAGPKAQVSPTDINFNDVNIGSARPMQINIRNLGGVPLVILNVRREKLPKEYFEFWHNDVAWTDEMKLPVEPGATLPLTLNMNLKSCAISQKEFAGAIVIQFANHHPAEMRINVHARVFSCSCRTDPKELIIAPCPSGGEATLRFLLINDGSSDLQIKAIQADMPWLSVLGGENGFDLLSSESQDFSHAAADGQPNDTRKIDLLVNAAQLPEGKHTASLLVHVSNMQEPFCFPVKVDVIKQQEYKEYIGIDFGTTNSVIAVNDPKLGMVLTKVPNRQGELTELIPSVLVFKGSLESSVLGYDAENASVIFPENTVRSIKRIIGCERVRTYFGQRQPPDALAGIILKKLVSLAELTFYRKTGQYFCFRRAIITVPANFYGVQIQDMIKACQIAGLETGRTPSSPDSPPVEGSRADIILKEPTAGAIFCMSQLYKEPLYRSRIDDGNPLNFLVFDYGGGTVDVSLVRVERLNGSGLMLTCIAPKGDNKIGGEGMTLGIMDELLSKCAAANPTFDKSLIQTRYSELEKRKRDEGWGSIPWATISRARDDWKSLAETAKIELSKVDKVEVRVPGAAIIAFADREMTMAKADYTYNFHREECEHLISGFLEKSKKLISDVMDMARAKPEFQSEEPVVDYVLHTGRASQMPAVQRAVREALPNLRDEQIIMRPELIKISVAQGAALYGSIKQGPGTKIQINTQDITLPFSYGYQSTNVLVREYVPIIPRDSPCPGEHHVHFGPDEFTDGRLQLMFYRNSGTNTFIDGNPDVQHIGEATVVQEESGNGCMITMSVDSYGILTIKVDDKEIPMVVFREEDDSWDA
jgi:molecular chaperone DnaK (HSP70)